MKHYERLLLILRIFVFWMLFFILNQSIFLAYNHSYWQDEALGDVLRSFLKAIPLNISTASYLSMFPILMMMPDAIYPVRIYHHLAKGLHWFAVVLMSLITGGELPLYGEWGTKCTYKAVVALGNLNEVVHTASGSMLVATLSVILLQAVAGIWISNKYVFISRRWERSYMSAVVLLLLLPIGIVGIRGGLKPIPINQSVGYYHHNEVLNLATVNSGWNVFSNFLENADSWNSNPYLYTDFKEARQVVDSLYQYAPDSAVSILTVKRPNIVILLLESFSADAVASFNGIKGITPNIDALGKSGLRFTRCYATARLSHEAMVATFSAFPSQPVNSIIHQQNKVRKLPSIVKILNNEGYSTSYTFGGQLEYGHIKSYIYDNEFQRITEGKDLPENLERGDLGIHDAYSLAYLSAQLDKERRPFFAALFTLSSHSPYDFPGTWPIDSKDERPYLNGVHYTDSCLGAFFNTARTKDWYDNTLFIIMADHSHPTPLKRNYYEPLNLHIPLLFYGPVLDSAWQGKSIDYVVSQTDVAATLLHQLDLDATPFHWSKDALNPTTQHFSFYAFDNGFGWVRDSAEIVWWHSANKIYKENNCTPKERRQLLREGKAYMQTMYQEYLDY